MPHPTPQKTTPLPLLPLAFLIFLTGCEKPVEQHVLFNLRWQTSQQEATQHLLQQGFKLAKKAETVGEGLTGLGFTRTENGWKVQTQLNFNARDQLVGMGTGYLWEKKGTLEDFRKQLIPQCEKTYQEIDQHIGPDREDLYHPDTPYRHTDIFSKKKSNTLDYRDSTWERERVMSWLHCVIVVDDHDRPLRAVVELSSSDTEPRFH